MPALLMTPLIAALALAACTVEPAPAPTSPAPPPAPAEPARKLATGPSLVIVTLDTTRADHMGAYGYEKAKTPVFDSLASQGVRFERAYATTPLTTPSHASMFTGLYPPRHGIRNNGDAILADSFQTLAETLQAQGYQTAASVSAFVTTRVWNLDQGFDVYFDQVHQAAPGARWGQERPAGEVVDDLVKWLDEGRDPKGAFVLWAHFYDAHHPYKPPEGFTEGFDMPYDGEIAYVDSQLGRLKQKVDAAAGPEGANWIVLADHGEAFDKQHGEVTHGLFVFDPTMRVPFVLRPAQPLAAPVVMKEPTVSGVDLTPTALGMLGLPVPEGLDGVDLSASTRSPETARVPVYMECLSAQQRFGYHPEIAVAEGRYKLIDTPSARLFDVDADPGELKNLVGTLPEVEARLRQVSDQVWAAGPTEGTNVAVEVVEQLAALGYVSNDFQHNASQSDVDAKDKVDVISRIDAIRTEMGRTEDLAKVEREYRAIIQQEPTLAEARLGLARAISAQGRHKEAEKVYAEAIELQPTSTILRANLANTLAAQGRHEEGLQMMLSILEQVPGDDTAQIGALRMMTDLKQTDRAIGLARQWLAEKPEDTGLKAHLGVLLARAGEYAESEELLRASMEDNIPRQLVQRTLGGLEKLKGRPRIALFHYQQELELFPFETDLWLDTARLHMMLEAWDEAAADYQKYLETSPDSLTARHGHAQAVFNLGDYAHAAEILAPALRTAPDDPDVLLLQANILAKLGRTDEGRQLAQRANELNKARIEAGPTAPPDDFALPPTVPGPPKAP